MDSSDQSDRSLPERTGQKLVDWLLKAGINGIGPLKSAEECAQEAMGKGRTEEQAIRHLIRTHVTLAGLSIGGHPLLNAAGLSKVPPGQVP